MGETLLTTTNELGLNNSRQRLAAGSSQVRSRERVIDLAEVFTHQREVDAMLDFVPDMFESIDSTFLEPACGNGNFLAEILCRKLAVIDEAIHPGSDNWFEVVVLRAVASIYAIDICNDNVSEARERLRAIVVREFANRTRTPSSGFLSALNVVLEANVICADTLVHASDIMFYEWIVDGESFARTPFPLEPREYDMFDLPPEPLAPLHYTELGGRQVSGVALPRTEPAHVPDVLETLAQLPNDEVFTPPKLANAMLDILPTKVWSDPELKWLDPATKSGVFLREAYKRLMVGLASWQPDPGERRAHIIREMLFGSAITTLSADIARRSVYQTKDATGASVADPAIASWVVKFDDAAGNIEYTETDHTIGTDGRCEVCRAPEALVREERETYAYAFNHGTYPTEEMNDVKFDVIVGNPPYQISAEGTKRTMPIYQQFVERAIEMEPKYVLMITPSRWFTGGLGLDEFRDRMIGDRRLAKIVDNPKIFDCFPQAKIRGGVSYFLWDRDHDADCEVSTRIDGKVVSTATRDLRRGHGVLVRDNKASTIIEKVLTKGHGSVEDWFLPRLAFNHKWRTNFRGDSDEAKEGSVPIIHNSGAGYVRLQDFERNADLVDKWKVLLPKASSGDTAQDDSGRIVDVVLGEPIAVHPGSICTESYFVAGVQSSREECANFARFLATKLVRFLVLQRKATQDITSERFRFVPALPMSQHWEDADLYHHFDLSNDEIKHIEASIKPRTINLSLDSPIPESHLPGGRKHRPAGV